MPDEAARPPASDAAADAATEPGGAAAAARGLADELLAISFEESPTSASLLGYPGHDADLPDLRRESEEALAGRYAGLAARASELDGAALPETDRQTLEFVRHVAAASSAATRLGEVEWTVTDLFVSPAAGLIDRLPQVPLNDEERLAAYRERLSKVPAYLETAAERHRAGVAAGRPPVARLVALAVAHLDRVLGDPALAGIARPGAEDVAERYVRPAFAVYRSAISDLLPAARNDDHPGLVHLPGGEDAYATLAAYHGAGGSSAAELHALGLEITGRLAEEYATIGRRAFGISERAAVFERLRSDPALRYDSSEEMLEQARAAVARAEAAAPSWFGTVPESACLVEPVPEASAPGAPPAYYLPPALDGSRAGTYFLNTASPKDRFRHTAEAYAFHEAVPGHHFQLVIAQQMTGVPAARRLLHDTASAEGWGLYSERLADEMGLYADDISRLGMLTADSWRAGRLVVDTGLHALGWSRSRAVDWLASNTPLSPVDIETEVDRYIAMPGQALSYMVGRLELQRLRAESSARLGAGFDLRAFHDLVLGAGPLPLPVLRGVVERWAGA